MAGGVTLSVAVMAHPRREKQVEHVLRCIGKVPVVWDEKNDRWDTGRRSMLAYDPGCSHHLVIQDDTLPCRDLLPGLHEALKWCPPDVPVCLYIGRRRPRSGQVSNTVEYAKRKETSWVTMRGLYWGPGVIVPTAAIPEMLAYCDPLTDVQNYDRRMSRYWELGVRKRTWYTFPSLLDHADGPSLVKGRLGTNRHAGQVSRVAFEYAGEDTSALELEWDGLVVDMLEPGEVPTEDTLPLSGFMPKHVTAGVGEVILFKNKLNGRMVQVPSRSSRVRQYRGLRNWEEIEVPA